MIDNIDRHDHILNLIEDPIEFLHNHKNCIVNQREVNADTHGFGAALAHRASVSGVERSHTQIIGGKKTNHPFSKSQRIYALPDLRRMWLDTAMQKLRCKSYLS